MLGVTGRRLDAEAPVMEATIPAGYGRLPTLRIEVSDSRMLGSQSDRGVKSLVFVTLVS
jgi:hypothetical protein